MMPGYEIAGLACAGAAAGAINSVAGGGTLVTFPTLLFFGTDAIIANATSTVALVIGTTGSVYGYRRHLPGVKRWLWRFVPVSVLGGLIGSALLTHTSNRTFSRLVPFLILFATLLFLAQGFVRRWVGSSDAGERSSGPAVVSAILFQLFVATYGGYFGAGIGILMLASLGCIGLSNIHQMNTLKTVLGALINVVAGAWFIGAGLIQWPKAVVLTGGALLGYYLGSHYSQKIPQKRVRQIVTLIGFILSAITFYKEFA